MVVGVVYVRNTMNCNALTEVCKPLEVVLLFRQRKSRPVVYGAQGSGYQFRHRSDRIRKIEYAFSIGQLFCLRGRFMCQLVLARSDMPYNAEKDVLFSSL